MEEQNTEGHLNIELNEETATGVYSNLAVITHSNGEFVTDFVQMMPGMPKALVRSRVIMNAQNAKKLMRALIENVKKYEQTFGVIEEDNYNLPPMNFGNPSTKA
ncbi:MAG: DUF3467 domain-containing protein [Flavobacteriia bacterium]|nr:DUF3467 domain-containing protein [Flavobacteriia bacterium]OJX37351.1 MAG: hypothetical protein BGO87_01555 [Flavobacteriia bacterium 40-80]